MPGDYVDVQTDNIKSQFAALKDLHKSQAARLVLLKATQKLFGPFQNFYYKMVGNYRVVTKLLGINTQAQGAATKQTNLLSKATKLLLVPLRLFRLTSLLTIGTILSVIAVFAYLSTSFGSTAHGAGRMMSRSKARRNFTESEVKKSLNDKGIFIKSLTRDGVVEETPQA